MAGDMKLAGKNALVTGGGKGIGRAIALKFAREGANVAIASRTAADLREVAGEIRLGGVQVLEIVCDVSQEPQILSMVKNVMDEFGGIDILVNNAGAILEKPVLEIESEEWDRLMNVNLRSVFLCTKAVLQHMVAQRSGKIVNIASGSGLRGLPLGSAYSASKAAVIAFGKSVAEEVRTFGINVNTICPGPVRTQMINASYLRHRFEDADIIDPEQVANAALYLASDDSKSMNGQIINLRNRARW
jgi:3-oxoacyl-[acyl-carrier protein] reductase